MATNSDHTSSSAAFQADEVKSEMAILGPAKDKGNGENKEANFTEVAGSEMQESSDEKYPKPAGFDDILDEFKCFDVNRPEEDKFDQAPKGAMSRSDLNEISSKGESMSGQKKGGRQGDSGKGATNLEVPTQGLAVAGAGGMDVESQGDKSSGGMKDAAMSLRADVAEERSSEASESPPMPKGMSSLQAQAEEGSKQMRTRSQHGRGKGAKAKEVVTPVKAKQKGKGQKAHSLPHTSPISEGSEISNKGKGQKAHTTPLRTVVTMVDEFGPDMGVLCPVCMGQALALGGLGQRRLRSKCDSCEVWQCSACLLNEEKEPYCSLAETEVAHHVQVCRHAVARAWRDTVQKYLRKVAEKLPAGATLAMIEVRKEVVRKIDSTVILNFPSWPPRGG